MKKELFIIMFFLLQISFSQEYGFLLRTKISGYGHANTYSAQINTDSGDSYDAGDYIANNSSNGNIYYDFVVLNNSFKQASVNLESSWEALHEGTNCTGSEKYIYNKQDFNNPPSRRYNRCHFVTDIYTLHIEEPDKTELCVEENLTLQYGYHWYFRLNGETNWRSFPLSLNTQVTTFTLRNLFELSGVSYETWKNKTSIHFTTGFDGVYTNIRSMTIIGCSPALASTPTPVKAKCSYSDDGSFTAQFERVLNASKDERMLVYVEKYNPYLDSIDDPNPWQYNDDETYIIPDNITTDPAGLQMSGVNLNWPDVLSAGKYRLRWVTKYGVDPEANPNSDEKSSSFDVGSPTPLTINNIIPVQPKCPEDKGKITVMASGGTGSYEYSKNNGSTWQTSNVFNDLAPDTTYRIKVKDANGCEEPSPGEANREVTINTPDPSPEIQTPLLVILPTVNGGGWTASVTTVTGGDGSAFTYNFTKISGPASFVQNGKQITGTGEGEFEVYVSDSRPCNSSPVTFIITEPDPLGVIFSEPLPIDCYGGAGSLRAQGTGGTSAEDDSYTYEWEDGSASAIRHGLSAGTYTVTVRDKNNNEIIQSYNFGEPDELGAGETVTLVKCKGEDNGSISLNISGGTGSKTVIWHKAFDSSFNQTGSAISGLSPGTYFYEITDANGCNLNNNNTGITITEPDSVISVEELPASHVNNNIYGGSTGALEIEVTGGTIPYKSIVWSREGDSSFNAAGTSLNTLQAGNYNVVITDANDCTATLTAPVEITEPGLLLIANKNITHVACYGAATGSIEVEVTGGIPPYHYEWTSPDGLVFTPVDSPEIENLYAGGYQLTVTDESGSVASITETFTVIQNTELVLTNINEDNICYNDNKGSIDLTVVGGTPPYHYEWSNGELTEDINSLPTGSYSVIVTDDLGCTKEGSFEITQPQDAVSVTYEVTHIIAFGYNDGSIDINTTGGATPYSFEWFSDNGFSSAEEDIDHLSPGHYTLVVYDANYNSSGSTACTAMQEFEIIEPALLEATLIENYSLSCYGDSNGEIVADVSGGVPPYQYEWYKLEGNNAVAVGTNNELLAGMPAGTYRVVVTDANGIEIIPEDLTLAQPEELKVTLLGHTDVECNGDLTGAIDITVEGGTPPYEFNWSNGNETEDLANIPAGLYEVNVGDSNGCIKVLAVEIKNLYSPLEITGVEVKDVSVFDGDDGSLEIELTGGHAPYHIVWENELGEETGNTEKIENLHAGNYTVSVEDSSGCVMSQTYAVAEPDIVEATIIQPACAGFCDGTISLVVNGGNGTFTYTWSNGMTGDVLTGVCSGEYSVLIEGYGNRVLERSYRVDDPPVLEIELGANRVLCQGQAHIIDGSIPDVNAHYEWYLNGDFFSNEPEIEVSLAGSYELKVTDSKGCQAGDVIEIGSTDQKISAEFAVSSQVFTGEPLVLVDVSNPKPDRIEWDLPDGSEIIEISGDYTEVVFRQTGEYKVGMLTHLGDCQAYQEKWIVVTEREDFGERTEEEESLVDKPDIVNFLAYPNPSTGEFTLEVDLQEGQKVSLKIFRLGNNSILDYRVFEGSKEYIVNYNLGYEGAGIYFIILETPHTTQVKKIIIE
ncbi:T9SS type A sorting domain-containing protein [Abyssalbus ytuae]|uniref:T9SS type A sorting domain-containing protein n=1 Tax=Abyssalbus ytuae TaxID=2926907 RepID=A0A9E6ZK18_9FLAO|nr:T9SS type A sorting domain-containing protein [Abyssalbus ytuae]UOB17069.1 T9SS type A sorting domain-containing protein [Abyssalbus ytuae]